MKPVEITHDQWHLLKTQLMEDYKPSVLLIRERTRSKLGFVPRNYIAYTDNVDSFGELLSRSPRDSVMLDFYDESKYTFFMMKYGSFVSRDDDGRKF